MLAHSYMSATVNMTTIMKDFSEATVDAFVMRATAKAFKAAVDS